MKAFYCDHFVLPLPEGHSFPLAKYRLLRERVMAEGLVHPSALIESPAATWAELALAHTPGYLEAVRGGSLSREAQRRIGFPWSPEMVERSRRSVGGTLAAARAALVEGAAVNLAGGTHHAFADRGEGYCVFNDVAVAARALLREGAADRILVVDCDVHQGNGTAAIFRDEPRVFTFSMHGANNFPRHKETSDVDLVLRDGTGDDEYLDLLGLYVPALLERQRPDALFYVSGADPFRDDRFGRLSLTQAGLRQRDGIVVEACLAYGAVLVVTMGGGYARDVNAIADIHANTVREARRAWRGQAEAGAGDFAADERVTFVDGGS